MKVTLDQLCLIMPEGSRRLPSFVGPLNDAMSEFEINTPVRAAAFLAQVAHESGRFRYMSELSTGDAYEGREDLGNTQPGDGRKFKGHGPIQITGRANHKACSLALYGDLRLLDNPRLLEQPEDGCRAAGWFWKARGLNELADGGEFDRITRKINGGQNGRDDRRACWDAARRVLV